MVHGIAEQGRVAVRNVRRDVHARPARAEERGRGRLRRRAPRRGRAPEAHRRARSARSTPLLTARKKRSSRSERRGLGADGALRRDHHGRQRALGAAARPARDRGPPRRRRHVKARLRDAVELGVEELTVYSFSTENWTRPRTEVEALMAMFARAHRPRDARAARGGRADALHRPARGRLRASSQRADGLGRGADRRQRPDHAVRGLQLRRPGGDRRRGANASRASTRGGVPRGTSTRPRCTTPTS